MWPLFFFSSSYDLSTKLSSLELHCKICIYLLGAECCTDSVTFLRLYSEGLLFAWKATTHLPKAIRVFFFHLSATEKLFTRRYLFTRKSVSFVFKSDKQIAATILQKRSIGRWSTAFFFLTDDIITFRNYIEVQIRNYNSSAVSVKKYISTLWTICKQAITSVEGFLRRIQQHYTLRGFWLFFQTFPKHYKRYRTLLWRKFKIWTKILARKRHNHGLSC